MNQIIKKQLEDCKVADLSNFNYETGTGIIPRFKQIKLEEDACYVVKLDNTLINHTEGDTYNVNWNGGTAPTYEYMYVEVSRIMGKNIKVNGVQYDNTTKLITNNTWSGWLPLDRIEILEKC